MKTNKILLKLFLGILGISTALIVLAYLLNVSLPYRSCGGSTLRGLANKCFPGFVCEPDYIPNIPGAGGTCLPSR